MKDFDNLIAQIKEEVQRFCGEIDLEGSSFPEIEDKHRDFASQIGVKVLNFNLDRLIEKKKAGYQGTEIKLKDGGEASFEGYRERNVKTYLGKVTIRRAYYWSAERKEGFAPLDDELGIGSRGFSPSVERGIAIVGVEAPFAKAEKIFKEIARIDICPKTIEEVTEEKGKEIEAKKRKEAEEVWKVFEGPSFADVEYGRVREKSIDWDSYFKEGEAPKRLYIQVDGGRVNTKERWKEPKVALFFNEDDLVKVNEGRKELLQKEYTGCLDGIDVFEKLVWKASLDWNALAAKEVVLNGDGAGWIWNHIAPLFPGATQILDWAHATKHLWDTGKALFGEGEEKTKEWVKREEGLLWEGKVKDVLGELKSLSPKDSKGKEAVQDLIGYYERNQNRMDYTKYRERGLHIGSGGVESGIKNVVNNRLKQCGMIWDKERANQMIYLRSEYLSEKCPPQVNKMEVMAS